MYQAELLNIPADQIKFDAGHRTEFGDLDALNTSFKTEGIGIIQPITVERLAEPEGNYLYQILAGRRRFQAAIQGGMLEKKSLAEIVLPARIYPSGELDPYIRVMIEKHENYNRKNLSPIEDGQQLAAIHKAFQAKYGKEMGGGSTGGHSLKDTAAFLGISKSAASRKIALSQEVSEIQDPKLRAALTGITDAATVKKIMSTAKRMAQQANDGYKAEQAGLGTDLKKLSESYQVVPIMPDRSLLEQGFFSAALKLDSSQFDLIELDPPYGVSYDRTSADYNYDEIPEKDYPAFISKIIEESVRLMKPNSWMLLWHANYWSRMLLEILADEHLDVRTGIWYKQGNPGTLSNPKLHLASVFEPFYYCRKGTPELNTRGRQNVLPYATVPQASRWHATQRPLKLMQELVRIFAPHNAKILVPCAGSGVTLRAAYDHGCEAIGFDVNSNHRNGFVLNLCKEMETEILIPEGD